MKQKDCCVLIPSLSPDERLPEYAKALLAAGFGGVVVVNDGSSREYDRFFDELRLLPGCTVLGYEVNRGKGYALRTGIGHILGKTAFRGIITADSDGQHTPGDTLKLAERLGEERVLLLGSRDFVSENSTIPKKSRFGNRMTSAVFKLLYGQYLPDTQTGLRAFSRDLGPLMLDVEGDRFEYEMNVLIRCSREKVKMVPVTIDTIYLEENKSTHFHPLKDSWRIYKILLGEKLKPILFAGTGVISWLIDYILRLLLLYLLFKKLLPGNVEWWVFKFEKAMLAAYVPARIISSYVNYLLNRNIVFGAKKDKGSAVRYYILVVFALVLSMTVSALLSAYAESIEWLVMIVVDIAVFVMNYFIQKHWVFRDKK